MRNSDQPTTFGILNPTHCSATQLQIQNIQILLDNWVQLETSPRRSIYYTDGRDTKSQNFPVGRILRTKTLRMECVNCFREKSAPKVHKYLLRLKCKHLPSYHPRPATSPHSIIFFKNIAHNGSHKCPKPATRWRSHWYFLQTALYVLIELHLCSETIPM